MASSTIATSYDFRNPFLAARIILKTGEIYPLWTSKANGSEIKLEGRPGQFLRALSFLTELQIELPMGGQVPRIVARLEPPYLDAIALMDSELLEFGNSKLQVQFGYASGVLQGGKTGPLLSDTLEGMTVKPEVAFGTSTQITITAQGVNGGFTHNYPGSGQTLKGTRKSIIEELCKRNQLTADFSEVEKDGTSSKAFDKEDSIAQGWRTDIFMLHYIVRTCGCYSVISGNKDGKGHYRIIPMSAQAASAPEITLAMYHFPKGTFSGSVFPIISAQSPTGAIWTPGVRRLLLHEIDPNSKQVTKKDVGDDTVKPAQTGPGAGDVKYDQQLGQAADESKVIGYQPHPGDPSEETAIEQSHAQFRAQKPSMGFPLNVETVGIPTLQPGTVVAVRGLGMRLDTNYLVRKIVHTLNASGYITAMELTANAGSLVNAQHAIKTAGSENKEQPKEGNSDSVKAQPKGQ